MFLNPFFFEGQERCWNLRLQMCLLWSGCDVRLSHHHRHRPPTHPPQPPATLRGRGGGRSMTCLFFCFSSYVKGKKMLLDSMTPHSPIIPSVTAHPSIHIFYDLFLVSKFFLFSSLLLEGGALTGALPSHSSSFFFFFLFNRHQCLYFVQSPPPSPLCSLSPLLPPHPLLSLYIRPLLVVAGSKTSGG